ncbi:hypothetical protein FRC16_001884 [Serendipita sp. 398]|nr:hypothetical protein FRC16_001884 [Serendipita sp. 398]
MASNTSDEDNGVLYLHHVTAETPIKSGYRIKLNIDGSDIQLTRNGQTTIWTPLAIREISGSTKAKVTLKTGHTVAGISFKKEESTVGINVQGAIQQFLLSMHDEILVSEKTTFHQQPAIISVSFRSPPTSESVRSTLQSLQEALKNFRHIMGDSTEKHLDTVIKYGVAFSELDPRSKAAFSVLSVTFELLKQQKQRDQMISSLTRQLGRVLPFADGALKEAAEDNADILRKTIGKLYVLTIDVAEFSCDYVKRNRFKRLAKSLISTQDQGRINELSGSLKEVVEDFARAVNIEMLKTSRTLGRI